MCQHLLVLHFSLKTVVILASSAALQASLSLDFSEETILAKNIRHIVTDFELQPHENIKFP